MHRIAQCLPDDLLPRGGNLWRTVALDLDDFQRLQGGCPVSLEGRDFESWSRSEHGIRHIMITRAAQAFDDFRGDGKQRVVVILNRDIPDEDCVLDVHQFFHALGNPEKFGHSWTGYGKQEHEVVVRSHDGISRIFPEDLVWSRDVRDEEIYHPQIGDTFDMYGEQIVVEELIGPDDCGCFEVRSGDFIYPLIHEYTTFAIGGAVRPVVTPEEQDMTI
jgi:hypothetical protein